ncbi:uncharacterized protein PRCAT00001096001 [Priceomyces carsonii]|uniref:uncharacterized protein n=1 Tax=Priceomyces carsonii TaxID=28549 RepID=UPI002ED921DB|nr:unnamed protein product [Priceomyces carsonii]
MFRSSIAKRVRSIRFYHAVDHPSSNLIINPGTLESTILTKSLEYVPKYGFKEDSITMAIRQLKYPDSLRSMLTGISSGKSLEYQLSLFWLKYQRQKLKNEVENSSKFQTIENEYDRVAFLIKKRLAYNAPVINLLSQCLSQLVIPYNINQSLEELSNLSDDIAFYSGDQSVDFSWYSKRLSLSSIYVSSELYMLQDSSPGFVRTNEFVDDKVEKLVSLGNSYNIAEEWAFFNAISLVNLIRSQLIRG